MLLHDAGKWSKRVGHTDTRYVRREILAVAADEQGIFAFGAGPDNRIRKAHFGLATNGDRSFGDVTG